MAKISKKKALENLNEYEYLNGFNANKLSNEGEREDSEYSAALESLNAYEKSTGFDSSKLSTYDGSKATKKAYEGAVEIAKSKKKTGAERYGLFSGENEELNKGILHKASKFLSSKLNDDSKEISEEDSRNHASEVLASVSDDNKELLKKYVDAQDADTVSPFAFLNNMDSPVLQKQQAKNSATMETVKKQFMENTGVDEKTFNKMLANYTYSYHAEQNDKQKEELQNSSKATKALASGLDVVASPVTGLLSLAGTGKNKVDTELGRDNHTAYASLKDFSENTEEAVLNDAEKIDNKALRTAAKGAYQVGMATGKSAMSMVTGSEAASALGLTGKSARAVANLVSLPQFGASAYTSTLEDAQERGLDTGSAYKTALVAGAAEMATEVISLEGIWDILEKQGKVGVKTAIGNVLKQGYFEGSEEVMNDLVNEIADGIINGDKSQYNQSVKYYMSDQYAEDNGLDAPLSEEAAKKKARIDFAKQVGQDFLLGGLSGALMGAGATTVNAYANTKGGQYLSSNEQIRDDIVLNKKSENYISDDRADYDSEEDYQKAQSAIEQLIDDSGEAISNKEARSLYKNVSEAIGSQNSNRADAQIQRDVETIESAQTPEELVRATESVSNKTEEVQQAIDNTKARMVAQGATQADFDNVITPARAYQMAKSGQVSESDLESMSDDIKRAAVTGYSESVSQDIKNVTKFDASTVLVKENGKAKQTNITGEVTKSGDQYFLTTKKGAKVELSEDILSGQTKANGDNTKGKLLMYGNSHAEGIISLEDPELMTIALQTKINQPSVPSTSIVKAVRTFNTLGRSGVSFDSAVSDKKQKFMVDAIGETVLRKAYDLGAKEGASDEQKMANPTTKKGSGKVSFASSEAETKYNDLSNASRTFIDKFAQKTGVDFEIFSDDADTEGTVRGQYVPEEGKIRLNVADDTDILEVAMHEGIGEFLKAHNAEGYAEITETVLNYYAENNADALAKRIEDYKRAYSDEKGKSTRGSADELVNDVLAEIFSDENGIEKLGNWLFENDMKKEAKTIKEVLIDFVNQMKSWIADIKAQGGLSAAERSNLSMAEKDMDALQDRILKAMNEAIQNRDSRAEGETAEQSIRNSVKVDANGKQYVEIDEDIVKGITGSKNIKSAVRAYIKDNYPSIDMMGFKLGVNAQSRNEFVNSKTSQYMQNKLKRFFIDKMRMAGNLEEIVNVGDGYTWEDIKHSRKDKLIGFVRGNVQIRVGNNDYIADIVLADDKTKGLIFYDIVNMNSTAIKEAPTERTHENHAAQVAGASTDSISQNAQNATEIVEKVAEKGRKSVRVDEPVSANDELVAIHNTTPQQLIDTIKLGGFPSPSIAVVKAAMGHEKYGTVSVVFGRDSIDPEVSKKNRIYGGDAWTAVFPKVEYKINEDVIYRLSQYLDDNLPSSLRSLGGYDCLDIHNAETMLGKGGLIDSHYANDPKFGYLFITKENGLGRKLEIPMKEADSKSGLSTSELEAVIAEVGSDKLSDIQNDRNKYFAFSEELPDILNEIHYKEYVKAHPETDIDSLPAFKQKVIKRHYNPEFWNLGKTDRVIEDVETLTKGNGFESTVDEYTLRDEIQRIVESNKDAYEKWIENLFDGVFEKQGLRNNRDIYDNMGNERSWEALHEKITLDNIVKLMNEEDDQGATGMFSQSVIQALATKKFKSIDDMKSSMNQLQMMSDEEYSAEKEKYFDEFSAIVNEIQNKDADNQFIAYQQAADAIADAVRVGTDEKTIMRELRRYGSLDLQADTAKRISNLMSDLSEMVTGYFEAKPKRAVYLDEILKVVCPSTEGDLVEVLKQNNIPYETYEEGNEEARKGAVNSTENARFSKKVKGQAELKQTITSVMNGNYDERYVSFGTTPAIYSTVLGIERLPMEMTTNHVYSVAVSEAKAKRDGKYSRKQNYHNLGADILSQLPKAMRNPAIIVKSTNDTSDARFVAVTMMNDRAGNPIMAAVEVNAEVKNNQGEWLDVNLVLSSYGKDNLSSYVNKAYKDNRILYVNKTNSQQIMGVPSVQFRGGVISADYTNNLRVYRQIVNENQENKPRTSRKVDNQGNKLTEAQQTYFKDSKVRNEGGNLLVMYHGTPNNDFYIFDAKKSKGSNLYGRGFYFAYDNSTSSYYDGENGRILECYLNITNPVDVNAGRTISDTVLHDMVSAVADEYGIEDYGYYATVDSVTEDLTKKKSDFAILQDLNATCIGDFTEMVKFLNDEVGTSYDGIITRDQVIAFYPNQIKKIDNQNPTENADIRYSRKVKDARRSIKEYGIVSPYHDTLNEANVVSAIMGKMNEALDGVSVDLNGVMDVTKSIIKKYDANISTNDLAGAIWQTFNYMNDNQMETDYQGMMDYLLNIGDEVIATSHLKDANQQAVYDEVRKNLRSHAIKLTDADRDELKNRFGSWKDAFGEIQKAGIKLDNSGMNVDSVYNDIREEVMNISGVQMAEETTAADQIISIIDTVAVLEPSMSAFEGASDLDNSLMVATDIIEEYYSRASEQMVQGIVEKTDAGKKAVKDAVDKQKKALREEMAKYKQTVSETYKNEVERYKTELTETQKQLKAVEENIKAWKPTRETKILNEKEIEATAKALAKQTLNDYKGAQEKARQIDIIKKTGFRLIKWLDQPTDKQHVPEFMQKDLANFLQSIDFLPKNAKANSKNTLMWKEQMRILKDVIAKLDSMDDSDAYALSEVLVAQDITEQMESLLARNANATLKISQLPAQDLQDLSKIMSALSAGINKMNATYANKRFPQISALARQSVSEMQELKATRKDKVAIGKVKVEQKLYDFLNLEELEPITYFEVIGKAGQSIYQELRDGFNVRTEHIRDTAEYFTQLKKDLNITDSEMSDWQKETLDFKLADGNITMSIPQIMSLMETVNRKQGKPHVEVGGIKISDTTVTGKIFNKNLHNTKAIHISEAEYNKIISHLSDKQIKMADAMQQYMATECAKWGNRVAKEMYGYKKFIEEDYFPLSTDSNSRDTKASDDNAPSYYSIKNASFTKALTPEATNAVVIDDIFSVFTKHVVQMANYDGYTLPISDAMRWFNYSEKSEGTTATKDGEIVKRISTANNIRENIDRIMGNHGTAYFKQFIKDINGDYAGAGGTPQISNMLMGNFKAQAVMANMRVVVQQPTAIIRATDRIESKYLLQAQLSLPKIKEMAEKSQKNSAISYWKAQGYYETSIGKSVERIITGEATLKDKINDKAGALAGIADDLTWGMMYRAAELKVMDQNPNLKYDTQAFTKKTVEIFEDIIDHTQVVDTIFHKSEYMRNQGLGYRTTSAFMAEPTKTYNMFYRSYMNCRRSGNSKEMVQIAGKTAMIFLVEQAVNAAVTGFIDAWRDDDKDEGIIGFLQNEAEHTKENFIENLYVWNLLPVIKEIQNFIDGYSATEYTTEGLSTAVSTISELFKVATGESNKTPYGIFYLVAQGISQLAGLPMASALREVKSLYNTLNGIWGGDDWYKSQTTQTKAENTKRKIALQKAITAGDLKASKTAMQEIYDVAYDNSISNGNSKNDAQSAAWTKVRAVLKETYQEQGDKSTATINRYVTLVQKTKKKVSGKNEFKAVTEKDARDTVKGW